MKHSLVILSFFFAQISLANIDNCKTILEQGDEKQFISCLENTCVGLSSTETDYKNCVSQNQILADSPLYTQIMSRFNQIQNSPKTCNSHFECSPQGKGCYEADYDSLLSEDDAQYLNIVGPHLGKSNFTIADGQPCNENSECQSFHCGVAPTQAGTKICMKKNFCRSAHVAETAPDPIQCQEGLVKDQMKKCRTQNYMEDRSRQLVSMMLNRNTKNICSGDDPEIKAFYQRLNTLNYSARAFEFLFSSSQTSDVFKMQNQLREEAQRLTKAREQIVAKLNRANKVFKSEYLVLVNLKPNSERMVVFRNKAYKEADLYAMSVDNGLAMDLMTDLETIRAGYNQELAQLYNQAREKIYSLTESFSKLRDDEKKQTFGTHRMSGRFFGVTKNEKQWNYNLEISDSSSKFFNEYNEGKVKEILSLFSVNANFESLAGSGKVMFDFPLSFNTPELSRLKNRGKGSLFTRTKPHSGFFLKKRYKLGKQPIFQMVEKSHDLLLKNAYSAVATETWDDIADPEIRIYPSCLQGNSVPDNMKDQYCGPVEENLKTLKSHMLAHFLLYGGNGKNKHMGGGYFGGEIDQSNQSNSEWVKFNMNGPRGHYFRYVYETFLQLEEAYQSLAGLKDTRIACLNRARTQGDEAKLFFNTYSAYNPSGVLTDGTNGTVDGYSQLPDENNNLESTYNTRNLSLRTSQDLGGNGSLGSTQGSSALGTRGSSAVNGQGQSTGVSSTAQKNEASTSNQYYLESHTEKVGQYSGENGSNDSFWNDGPQSSEQIASNRSLSGLSNEELDHVMKNLNNYEAPPPAQNTIFETISESYVDKAYPAIFQE